MTEYAIVDDGSIVGFRNFDSPPSLPGKPYRQFLPTEYVTPDYDSATETLTGSYTDDVQVDKVVRTAVVRDKTESELAAAVGTPSLYAVAQLIISPGDIGGIDVNSKFSAALYMDVGNYLVFFTEEQPDTSYLAKAYDDASKVRVTEKTTSYIAITAVDGNGDPVDPDEISVEIIRVN